MTCGGVFGTGREGQRAWGVYEVIVQCGARFGAGREGGREGVAGVRRNGVIRVLRGGSRKEGRQAVE